MSEPSAAADDSSSAHTGEPLDENHHNNAPSPNNPENDGDRYRLPLDETRIEILDDAAGSYNNDSEDGFQESKGPSEQEMQYMSKNEEETLCRICYLPTDEKVSAWKRV